MTELVRREGHEVEFRVTIPVQDVQAAYAEVYQELRAQVKVPGFRPGKAPRSVLIRRLGAEAVEQRVQDRLIDRTYSEAVRELNLRVVAATSDPGPLSEDSDFSFGVKAQLYPEFTLPDWRSFTLTEQDSAVTDEMVGEALSELANKVAKSEKRDRPAQEEDILVVLEDGEKESYSIDLAEAYPQIRQGLSGHAAGEQVVVALPETVHGEGEQAHRHPAEQVGFTILEVRQKLPAEVDEALAKELGHASLEELRAALRAELEQEARRRSLMARLEEFLGLLSAQTALDIPSAMTEQQARLILEETASGLAQQNIPFETYQKYLSDLGKWEEFLANTRQQAATRVKRDLLLGELARELGVRVSSAELDDYLQSQARAEKVSPAELRRRLGADGLRGLESALVRDKALVVAVAQIAAPRGAAAESEVSQAEQAAAREDAPTEEPQG